MSNQGEKEDYSFKKKSSDEIESNITSMLNHVMEDKDDNEDANIDKINFDDEDDLNQFDEPNNNEKGILNKFHNSDPIRNQKKSQTEIKKNFQISPNIISNIYGSSSSDLNNNFSTGNLDNFKASYDSYQNNINNINNINNCNNNIINNNSSINYSNNGIRGCNNYGLFLLARNCNIRQQMVQNGINSYYSSTDSINNPFPHHLNFSDSSYTSSSAFVRGQPHKKRTVCFAESKILPESFGPNQNIRKTSGQRVKFNTMRSIRKGKTFLGSDFSGENQVSTKNSSAGKGNKGNSCLSSSFNSLNNQMIYKNNFIQRNNNRMKTVGAGNCSSGFKLDDIRSSFKKGKNNSKVELRDECNYLTDLKNALEKTGKIVYNIYKYHIKGKLLSIIKTQKGSQILQKALKSQQSTQSDILNQMYLEIKPNLDEIITDNYGNYFIQMFFTLMTQKDKLDLLSTICPSLVRFSSDSIGTYSIQGIVENLGSLQEKYIVVEALKGHVEQMILDPCATHVIEKILGNFEEEIIEFIYIYVRDNFNALVYDQNGICVIKKMMTFKHKKELHLFFKAQIISNFSSLISHQYASGAIQTALEDWLDTSDLLSLLKGHLLDLSLGKFSSNAVERAIERGAIDSFAYELSNSHRVSEVMKNAFGNYVMQKALKVSSGADEEIRNKIVFECAKGVERIGESKIEKKWKDILKNYIGVLTPEQISYLKSRHYFD